MVIANLNQEAPVYSTPDSHHPLRIQAVRDAGGPASGEPVQIQMTLTETKQLIERLQDLVGYYDRAALGQIG